MGTEVSDSVTLVGAHSVDLPVDCIGGRVVVDDPFPVGVGLCFERGPESGEGVRLRVVRRGDD